MGRIWVFLLVVLVFSSPVFPQNEASSPPQVRRLKPPPANASAAALEQLADELRAEKSFADALDYYRAAIKKRPTDDLYNKAGICELQMLHLDASKKDFQRALKLNPESPEAHNNLGVVFYSQKKLGKAIKEYQNAVKLNESSASFHSNLGTAYMEDKKFDKMTAEFSRALELDPQIFEHRSQTGVLLRLGKPEDRAQYSFLVAKVYAKLGNSERSLHYLREALENGYKDIGAVYKDNDFAALRKDPRFSELMAQRPTAIPQ